MNRCVPWKLALSCGGQYSREALSIVSGQRGRDGSLLSTKWPQVFVDNWKKTSHSRLFQAWFGHFLSKNTSHFSWVNSSGSGARLAFSVPENGALIFYAQNGPGLTELPALTKIYVCSLHRLITIDMWSCFSWGDKSCAGKYVCCLKIPSIFVQLVLHQFHANSNLIMKQIKQIYKQMYKFLSLCQYMLLFAKVLKMTIKHRLCYIN